MAEGSKLARRMAYKKQLEEEYRLAAEKIQVTGVKKHHGYTYKLADIRESQSYESMTSKRMNKVQEEEEINRKNKIIDETNRLNAIVEENIRKDRLKEENSRKENERVKPIEVENGIKEKERFQGIIKENKIEEREISRALQEKDNERIQRMITVEEETIRERGHLTLDEVAHEETEEMEDAKEDDETFNQNRIKEEEEHLAMQEQLRLEKSKKLEEQKKIIELKELEEIRKLKFEEDVKTEEAKLSQEAEKAIKDLELEELEEMKKTEERIKQLELSIASLDDELERFEIERMRGKTKKVMKRMSLVISDTTDDELDDILQQTTVNGFMENEILWGKYLGKENV